MEGSTQELRRVLSEPPPDWHPLSPGGPPRDPIAVLHASLERLRGAGDERHLFLRTLLEALSSAQGGGGGGGGGENGNGAMTREEEELLFHCAVGLRHATLLRWESLRPSFRICVRDLCLAAGLGLLPTTTTAAPPLPRTVAMALLGCASSFWKRGWAHRTSDGEGASSLPRRIDDDQQYLESLIGDLFPSGVVRRFEGEDARGELFAHLNSLLASPFAAAAAANASAARRAAAMSASFLSLLLGEFAGGGPSSARYNLPLEFHRSCHRLFESGSDDDAANGSGSGLDDTLRSSMTALSCLVGHVLNDSGAVGEESLLELGSCIIDVTCDALSWEFGAHSKWDAISSKSLAGSLLRLPQRWRETLINPEFLGAMINVYVAVRGVMMGAGDATRGDLLAKQGRMAHQLRQLLMQLSSIAGGPIFANEDERGAYARFLMDGCLDVLESILNEQRHRQPEEGSFASDLRSAEIVDFVTILSRLTANFRIKILSELPAFPRYLSALCTTGEWLLESMLCECQRVEGDVESMEGVDWKNDAIAQILHCSDAMAGDFWLVSGAAYDKDGAVNASRAMASILAPLYGRYCMCRVRMSCLEEHFVAREGADLDEIREEISAFGMDEEMASAASLGRLNMLASMTMLSEMFRQCTPRLMSLFEMLGRTDGDMTPDMAALLEESRMLLVCACHLLTNDCTGETPAIPESVIHACQPVHGAAGNSCLSLMTSLVEMLKSVAEAQATKVAAYPADSCLSPLLAKTLLWFFRRWAPAYILPSSDEYRENAGGVLSAYSKPETAQPVISFCTTLCLLYFCHWPQEKEVQDESASLLLALAKKGAFVRDLMVNSPSFEKMAALHSACASLRHTASHSEVLAAMAVIGSDLSIEAVRGYQRLPYSDRARVLTCLVVACSEMQNEKANAMFVGCLKAVETPFSTLVQALS